jgi:drug/metabolite transporter (DMT)-like permease
VYGHFAGVNWVWATELALFHSVWSITLPIVVVGLVFPGTIGVPFLRSARARWGVLAVFVATVGAMFVLFNRPETPGVGLLLAALVAMAALVVAARRAPSSLGALGFGRAPLDSGPSPLVLGALFVWGFFGLAWVGPRLVGIPAVVALAILGWCLLFGVHIARHRDRYAALLPRLDFVFGALTFLLVLAAVLGVFGDFGALPVVAAVVVVTWRLRRHLRAPAPPLAPWGATTGFPT